MKVTPTSAKEEGEGGKKRRDVSFGEVCVGKERGKDGVRGGGEVRNGGGMRGKGCRWKWGG